MSKRHDIENAAIYSFASLAAEFVIRPEIFPDFLEWASKNTGIPWDSVTEPGLRHLSEHLITLAAQAVQKARNPGGNLN